MARFCSDGKTCTQVRLNTINEVNMETASAHLFSENVKHGSVETGTSEVNPWCETADDDQLVPTFALDSEWE